MRWLRIFFQANRRATVMLIGITVFLPMAAWVELQTFSRIVDAAAQGRLLTESASCALLLAMLCASAVGAALSTSLGSRLAESCEAMWSDVLSRACTGGGEDPDVLARASQCSEALLAWAGRDGVPAFWRMMQTRSTGIAAMAYVASWNWPLALVLAVVRWREGRAFSTYQTAINHPPRALGLDGTARSRYLLGLISDKNAAAEVRVFGLGDWLIQRQEVTWRSAMTENWRARSRGFARPLVWEAGWVVGCSACLVLLARDVADGMAVGEALAVLVSIPRLAAFGPVGGDLVHWSQWRSAFTTLESMATGAESPRSGIPERGPDRSLTVDKADFAPASPSLSAGVDQTEPVVSLSDVSFSYPGCSTETLRNVDLHIARGECIAIVGENGAGKTTLLKLVLGLHEPTAGTVLVGGAPPRADPHTPGAATAVFQKPGRYDLPWRDSLLLGTSTSEERALAAADVEDELRRLHLDHLVSSLDHEPDQPLSESDPVGGLSGGQWQRLALARALISCKAGRSLLVMDEPSAALDARGEAELFFDIKGFVQGMTTLVVSHRLATVRKADRILVLKDGHVVEEGSHESLLAPGGEYSRMFRVQASAYVSE